MKISQTYLLIYKKNYIESLIYRKKFSTKLSNTIKDECINAEDYKNLQILFKWAKEKGGVFDNFQIKYLDFNNRFVTTKNTIKKSELIAKFPNQLIFSKDTNQIAEIYQIVKDMDFSDQVAIYVFFTKEFLKGENSFYYEYLKVLPMDVSCHPHYFNPDLKRYMKGSLLEKEVLDQIKLFNEEYEIFEKRKLATFSFEDYMKIRLILGARLFEVSSKENKCGLIPVADLCNYDPDKINTKWTYDDKIKCFTIKAINDIIQGEESNLYFLTWYGFTLNNNPEKISEYPIEVGNNDVNYKEEKNPQIKLSKDLDLYPIVVELSAHMHIEEFINGFYCFNDAEVNRNKYKREDQKKELLKKLKTILQKLKILITKKLDCYYNDTINKDKEVRDEALNEKNFNIFNLFNVIIEEKQVK